MGSRLGVSGAFGETEIDLASPDTQEEIHRGGCDSARTIDRGKAGGKTSSMTPDLARRLCRFLAGGDNGYATSATDPTKCVLRT